MLLGALAARLGRAPLLRAALRVGFWGVAAMGVTALIGRLFDTAVLVMVARNWPGPRHRCGCGRRVPADAARLSLLGRATFLESYAHLLPVEDILEHADETACSGPVCRLAGRPRLPCAGWPKRPAVRRWAI